MKKLLFFFFISTISFAQTDTEVYLFDLHPINGTWEIGKGKNISNNKGYDSQPSFYNKKYILFASTRNKQTDIAKYNIEEGTIEFLSNTPNGGEYSPQQIPKSKNVSAVRLDTDGLQRLYEYDTETGNSNLLIEDLKVAYPMWYRKNTIIFAAIVDEDLDLIVHDRKTKKNITVQKKVGRSLHKIPNSSLVSYISKEDDDLWQIRSLNLRTGVTKMIVNTFGKQEDICWLPDGTLLIAKKNVLFKYNPATDSQWIVFHSFPKEKFKNISRILVNKKGTRLVLVSE